MDNLKHPLKHETAKTVARRLNQTTREDFLKHRNDKQLKI